MNNVPPPATARPRTSTLKMMFWLLLVPIALIALYFTVVLKWNYSAGERAGWVQKLSRKGWLCKTWEGTLYTDVIGQGFRSDSFNFTVRSDSLAREMAELSGKRVAVQYKQHTLVPTSCFGDTEYFVSSVRAVPR